MRGNRPIQWLWTWLGTEGSQGEQYEVLPSVQPTVEVTPFPSPVDYGWYSNTIVGIGAGGVSIPLPAPDLQFARIWMNLYIFRTVQAAGDISWLRRTAQGQSSVLWESVQVTSGKYEFVIGGTHHETVAAEARGISPKIANSRTSLEIFYTSTVGGGNYSLNGLYVDVPVNAPIPYLFL